MSNTLPFYVSARCHFPQSVEYADAAIAAGATPETVARVGSSYLPVAVGVSAPDMAVLAAKQLIDEASVVPLQIGFLAHAWLYHQGCDFWSPAHYIARHVGALQALPFGVQQMSNGGAMGLQIVRDMMTARPGRDQLALVTTADRFQGPGFDRWSSDYDVAYGDGAVAALLYREARGVLGECKVLAMESLAMPELEDMYHLGDAFSAYPLQHSRPINIRRPKRAWLESGAGARLAQLGPTAVGKVVARALDACNSGDSGTPVAAVALPRIGQRTIEQMYLPALRDVLPHEIVVIKGATGHLGAGDFLANIDDIGSALTPGQRGVIVGGGGGFTLSCMILEKPLD